MRFADDVAEAADRMGGFVSALMDAKTWDERHELLCQACFDDNQFQRDLVTLFGPAADALDAQLIREDRRP